MPSSNQTLQDELTERDVHLERYRRGLYTRILRFLTEAEEDVLRQLERMDPTAVQRAPARQARLTRLLAEMGLIVQKYSVALNENLLPELDQLARDEATFGHRLLGEVPPVALETVAPAAAQVTAAVTARPFQGRLLREWVAEHPAAVRMRLRNAIRMGVVEGQTIDQIVRRVRGTKANGYRDGVMEVNRRGAEAMVRTAVSHTVTAAREEVYSANADIIKGVRWVSTLDSRTSQTCIGLDGTVFPPGKGPRPPAHVNCRSSTVPVLRSWKELGIPLGEAPTGTRASMDGQVAGDLSYGQWLKTRSAEFQDEVLGKTRAQLWRSGGLTVDRFVDNSGRVYTLKELRRREPAAFRDAGI